MPVIETALSLYMNDQGWIIGVGGPPGQMNNYVADHSQAHVHSTAEVDYCPHHIAAMERPKKQQQWPFSLAGVKY